MNGFKIHLPKRNFRSLTRIFGVVLILLVSVTSVASASGSQVIPPDEAPKGYSLADAAAATAYFNVGPKTSDTLPQNFPFQILYDKPDHSNEFVVGVGTMFYVPVVYSSDIDAAYWPFPDVTDQAAVTAYYFDPQQLGAEYIRVIVDGKVSDLGPGYAVGAVTPGLPDGGNNYTVAAAFLPPLPKGDHTVTIAGKLFGGFLGGWVFEFEISYKVTVQ